MARTSSTKQADAVPVKDEVVAVKLTADQLQKIQQSAARCGLRPATWVRLVALQAADAKRSRNGTFQIREPRGVTT